MPGNKTESSLISLSISLKPGSAQLQPLVDVLRCYRSRLQNAGDLLTEFIKTFFLSLCLVGASFAKPVFAEEANVAVELNKVEPRDKNCRVFVLIANKSEVTYQSLKLDLILFRPDGVIERRLALDLAPVRATKTSVKTFDLDALECGGIASILINDAIECKAETGLIAECLDRLSVTSRASVKFTK